MRSRRLSTPFQVEGSRRHWLSCSAAALLNGVLTATRARSASEPVAELQDRFRVFFRPGQTVVPPEYESAVASAVELVGRLDYVRVTVHGHSDRTGTRTTILRTAQDRANNVADALFRRGIAVRLVHVEAFGSDRPFIAGSRSSEMNRRAEISVYGIPKLPK